MPVQFFTEGDDTDTVSTAGDYTLVFLGGSDKLTVTGGTTITAAMGEGDDLVSLKAGAPAATTVYGESGADRFDIWAAGIAAYGGGDSDLFNIRAGGGQSIFGESGNDRFNFYGDVTAVNVDGGDGNDDFYGYGHSIGGDVYGGAGNDYFVGFVGTGGATIHGGLGNDIFRVDPANAATFQENVGEGLDSVQVARGDSYVLPDNIENISVQGFSGSVLTSATLTGNESNNHIVTHNKKILCLEEGHWPWQIDAELNTVGYENFGGALTTGTGTAPAARDLGNGQRGKTLAVSAQAASALRATPLDIVTQRLDGERFDLVVATNILPYFDDPQLALAVANIAAMVTPGGAFLHNEQRPIIGDLAAAMGLPLQQSRHAVIATVTGAKAPLYDSVFLHVRPAAAP